MSETLVLTIDPDGTLTALSGSGIEEALDLRRLGPIKAERAGHIFFDEADQSWGWKAANGLCWRGGFRTRREAVADEIATMSAAL
jgi:hypothetical protein